MAFPVTCTPASFFVSIYQSQIEGNSVVNALIVNVAPMGPAGGLVDFTDIAFGDCNLNFDNNEIVGTSQYLGIEVIADFGSGGPSGLQVGLNATTVQNNFLGTTGGNLTTGGVTSGRASITAFDGTTTLLVGVGTWQIITAA